MASPATDSTPVAEQTVVTLLEVLTELVRETRQGRVLSITLDSHLERDVGLDSLTRAELLLRLEQALAVNLPQTALTSETPRELLRLILTSTASPGQVSEAELSYQPLGEAESAPIQADTLLDVLEWHVRAHPER
ncbi:MAG: acyl carrier protein, partial [Candidatus Competibacteraceae bacterium]|nr:acyl carrier protein [Candidatus Competibacteraceae bacterium]